ncbi:hypothetical protein ABT354_37440 [Streptomyces sp. NPDC000594]|uniref:hypothetical protein n=1 Tax=Streptomyces sp. NPDC000594 TaxID=3154261 RepID=UPI00332821E6
MKPELPETLLRLKELIRAQNLSESDYLDPVRLGAETALPVMTVANLLAGRSAPADTVNERVTARLKKLAQDHVDRTKRSTNQLAADIARKLGISENWARHICNGTKVPNIGILSGLVEYWKVDGEAFFTVSAEEALNRVLVVRLGQLERPESDPFRLLMEKHGLKAMDMRHSPLSSPDLERLIVGVIQSVLKEPKDQPEGQPKNQPEDQQP